MKKTIILISGKSNQGKSQTIKNIASILLERIEEDKNIIKDHDYADCTMILTYKGYKIGIESQGDPNSRL